MGTQDKYYYTNIVGKVLTLEGLPPMESGVIKLLRATAALLDTLADRSTALPLKANERFHIEEIRTALEDLSTLEDI